MQARDQAGATAQAQGELHGRAQGGHHPSIIFIWLNIFFNNLHLHPPAGLHPLPGQPQEGEEADREEVVLRLPGPRARDRLRQQAAARHTPAAAHLSRQVRRRCPNR